MERIILIKSGGDWYDADVKDIAVPEDLDLDAAHQEYKKWRRKREWESEEPYQTFDEWLVNNKSCKYADLEEFWDD